MTAKQKANRERFKKAIAEAAKIRAKNPKLSQAEAVKKAWAIIYSKKRAGKVGAVKKAAKKSPRKSEYHKDTHSHNVNIRVMSGLQKTINRLRRYYIAVYITPEDIYTEYFMAHSLKEAKMYANMHKRNNKIKGRVEVRLDKKNIT